MLDLTKEKNILEELERNNIIVNKINYLTKGKDEFKITIDKNTCVWDKDNIMYRVSGAISQNELEQCVEMIIGGI